MDPFTLALIAAGLGGFYVYKKRPDLLPKALQPKAKAVALDKVVQTSAAATPHATAGMDPGMTTADVAAANQLLASSKDASAMNAMASSLSEAGHNNTAKALIAKADSLGAAKASGASDDDIYKAMMAAGNANQTVASQTLASAMASQGATVTTSPSGTIHSEGAAVQDATPAEVQCMIHGLDLT
jgi:hypothetical protein